MYVKPIERMIRMMAAQRLDLGYIRHYVMETFQLTDQQIDDILRRLNILPPPGTKGPAPAKDEPIKIKKQGFF